MVVGVPQTPLPVFQFLPTSELKCPCFTDLKYIICNYYLLFVSSVSDLQNTWLFSFQGRDYCSEEEDVT